MRRTTHLVLLLLCLTALQATAQYNLPQSRIWAMGNKVGLDFTNINTPVPIATALANANEAAASICDENGNLLFYTNGTVVWNKNGVQMPNGGALTGPGIQNLVSTLSTTQGAVIMPMPDSAGKYFLFSLTQISNCKLFCNKIDMSLNGGLGDVDPTFYLFDSSLADSFLTEKMTPVAGCNNSIWLMLHTQNSPVFRAYHVTPNGIDLTPVLSAIGIFGTDRYQQGVIKFSTDGTKMLTCNFRSASPTNAGLEVFDFDKSTGLLSNEVFLDSNSFYGGTFSPDGTKVYAGSTVNSTVSQWDLTAANPHLSKTDLGALGQYTDLKLGPDGKIYFGAAPGGAGYNNYRYMGRINDPNTTGIACDYKDSLTALYFPNPLNGNGALAQGMPNDVIVPVPGVMVNVRTLDTTICAPLTAFTLTAPAGNTNFLWDNGDVTATRTVTARGTYWVRSSSACDARVDTFILRGADMPALSIDFSNNTLTATANFASYQWYENGTVINGATNSTFMPATNGTYAVFANFGGGCNDSESYVVTGVESVNNQYLNNISFYPNPATNTIYTNSNVPVNISVRSMDGKEMIAAGHVMKADISTLPGGLYLLEITDDAGHRMLVSKLRKD